MLINFIGDIHGYASELRALLARLGYRYSVSSGWIAGEGQLVFLGDLIDRGPEQKETVEIVRELCERGYAACLTGNHEFNAVGFVTERIDEPVSMFEVTPTTTSANIRTFSMPTQMIFTDIERY